MIFINQITMTNIELQNVFFLLINMKKPITKSIQRFFYL